MMTPAFSPARFPAPRRAQSGVVLFIALIVMVAMSIAGIALVRSVDTGLSVIGNLEFHPASLPPSTWAVENAIHAMFEAKAIDLEKKDLNNNYFPFRYEIKNAGEKEDATGVHFHLQGETPSNYPGSFQKTVDGAGNTVRYVIERMCLDEGPATAANCDMSPPKKSEATTAMELEKPDLVRVPFYRVTIRIDGPNNTTTFAQAMLR